MVLMKKTTSSESELEICSSGKYKASMVVWMDEFSKWRLFDLGEDIQEYEEQMEHNMFVI